MSRPPKTPQQTGGVNIVGPVDQVTGDIVGGDKITVNFGTSFEAEVKLAAAMASLSERALERQRLATRWILEITAAVLVDEMRMLYVGTSAIARRFNADRYAEFVSIAEHHIGDFNNQFNRYVADLSVDFISKVRLIEQRCIWAFSRLKSGICALDMGPPLFREMKTTADKMHLLCSSVDTNGYKPAADMIAVIAQTVWKDLKIPCGIESLDALWQTRLTVQTILLKKTQEGEQLPITTIADDMHQNFSLPYFLIDRWLMHHLMR